MHEIPKPTGKISRYFPTLFPLYMRAIGVVGRFNTRLLLTIVYWVLIPFFTVFQHAKKIRSAKRTQSTWQPKESELENAHENQF